jgi:hypothetical protein
MLPPPTTKAGSMAPASFQSEFHTFMVGFDIEEKCRWTEYQIRYAIGDNVSRFSLLKFHQTGSSLINAKTGVLQGILPSSRLVSCIVENGSSSKWFSFEMG